MSDTSSGDYVARPGKRGARIGDFLFFINVFFSRLLYRRIVRGRARRNKLGKRCKSAFTRDGCAGLALRAKRAIYIVRFGDCLSRVDRSVDLIGELSPSRDQRADLLLALFEIAQVCHSFAEPAQCLVVKSSGCLLPVTRNKRNRIARVEQLDRGGDLFFLHRKLFGDNLLNVHFSVLSFCSRRSHASFFIFTKIVQPRSLWHTITPLDTLCTLS